LNFTSTGFPSSSSSRLLPPPSFISSFRYGKHWSDFWLGSYQAPCTGWLILFKFIFG
jgi:hypothetical protein